MSNLGWYQWITTASKKVGGPLNLLAIIGGSCLAVGGTVGSMITNKYRDIKSSLRNTPVCGQIELQCLSVAVVLSSDS